MAVTVSCSFQRVTSVRLRLQISFNYKENEEFDVQYPAAFLLGTSYRDAYVLMDVFCDRKRIESRVLQLNDTIIRMEFPYKEAYGKGITILFQFL